MRLLLVVLLMFSAGSVRADEFDIKEMFSKRKTLGGKQFFGDVYFFQGWKIQHNLLLDNYRLLDGDDYEYESGTREECLDALQKISEKKKLEPMSGKAVIVIHGMARSSKWMSKMGEGAEEAGYHSIPFDYPSLRVSIPDSAEYLHQVIDSLQGVEEIHIIAHSMGGLVTRAYFLKHHDPRIKRVVLIGVPNQGAELADLFENDLLYRQILGPGAQQLVTDADGLIPKLPVPPVEFGVIAGGSSTDSGFNPVIPGDDDGIVSVDSARLGGASDFVMLNCFHSRLVREEKSVNYAIHFLQTGQFRTDELKYPIPKAEPQP